MDLIPEDVLAAAIADAHESCGGVTSDVKHKIVEALHELESGGAEWATTTLDAYAASGAAKAYADWRRKHRTIGKTKKGTSVDLPSFGAATERDVEGSATYVQLPLAGMSLDQVRERRNRLAKQRDTMSVEVRFLSDLIEAMESDASLATAGDAIRKLGLAA